MKNFIEFFKRNKYLAHFILIIPPLFYFFTAGRYIGLADTAMMINRMVNLHFSTHVNRHNLAMLFGHLFTKLPIENLAFKCNLMVSFFGSISIMLFYFLIFRMTKKYWISIITTLIMMVSHSIWWHSTIAENYIINVFFILLILHCYVSYTKNKKKIFLYIAFFLSGLSLFNHIQNAVWVVSTAVFALIHFKQISIRDYFKNENKVLKTIIYILSILCFIIFTFAWFNLNLFDTSLSIIIYSIITTLFIILFSGMVFLKKEYKKIFSIPYILRFLWFTLVSIFWFLIGFSPYLYVFLQEVARRGGNISAVIDSASGGQFKNIMFNFSDTTGLAQSFWYYHLQFPSIFYFIIIYGFLYFIAFSIIQKLTKRTKLLKDSLSNNTVNTVLKYFLVLTVFIILLLIILYIYNPNLVFLPKGFFWHYNFSIFLFFIASISGIVVITLLIQKGFLNKAYKNDYFKMIITLIGVPGFITLFFFAFFNTWDQYAFLLPFYVISGVIGALFLNKILISLKEYYEKNHNRKINYPKIVITVLLILGIVFPIYYYSQIGEWSQDPGSWWFHYGPYRDRRFINTHNRVEYNYNPNKRNYDDMHEIINLLFDKLPQNASIIDDDSRTYYPVNLYYRKYEKRNDNNRRDLRFQLINVWGHENWGISVDRVVSNIEKGIYQNDNLFLIACRNYPHRDIINKLNSNKYIFLPFKLDNTHWVYKLKTFTEKEKENFKSSFPPLNIWYMYFGLNIYSGNEISRDWFKYNEDIMVRIRFDRLRQENMKPFNIVFTVYDSNGNIINSISKKVENNYRAVHGSLEIQNKLSKGTYTVKASVYSIVLFERDFVIK